MFVAMQKRIRYVLLLMTCCVIAIMGLQLYWNYQSYATTVANFQKDANVALENAANEELAIRHNQLVQKMEGWLADTSFITITCDIDNRDSVTVFKISDTHPRFKEDIGKEKTISMGIGAFTQKLRKITPEAKEIFIRHFANHHFRPDLEDGSIFYYTQGLGDSITVAFDESRVDKDKLASLYKGELEKLGVYSNFTINGKDSLSSNTFATNFVNTSLRRPFVKDLVKANLETPNAFYLKKMKWLIFSSLLLIAITLFCFYYTIKTLFNQSRLVAIKNQFISNMTHEINTPLSSIKVTAEALKQFELQKDDKNKYLDIILYQTDKLNKLTEEILENVKVEAIGFEVNEDLDIHHLIVNLIKDMGDHRGFSLGIESTDGPKKIKGNKLHLSRAIANIVENAFKYNLNEEPNVKVDIINKKDRVTLNISDDGLGIADEFKEQIFEQFFRIPTGNLHNIKGYGLGLTYAKKVITQHNGSISIVDNHPSGTIFSINLPVI